MELVEVVRGDCQELDAFQQRLGAVSRLREHAGVERQPAQLAVDVQRRIAEVGFGRLGSVDWPDRFASDDRFSLVRRYAPSDLCTSKGVPRPTTSVCTVAQR